MIDIVIYGLIFIGVLMIVEGVYLLVFGKKSSREKKVNRRLDLLESGGDREDVLIQLRKERERHVAAGRIPLFSIVFQKAAQANVAMSPASIVIWMGLIAFAVFIMFSIATSAAPFIRFVISLAIGYVTVFMWLRKKAKRRIDTFEEQLPDAMELIVRSLRIGHPFASSVGIVAQEMPDPLGTEFGIISDEAAYGKPITESLEALADRVDVPDLRFLAVAVTIQSQSGGNLAEVLEGLSRVIRSRFKLFRKIKAITAEARWSGWFLSIFPVLALVLVQLVEPNYYDNVADHPFFVPGTIIVVVFLVLNVLFMRAMVNIKV